MAFPIAPRRARSVATRSAVAALSVTVAACGGGGGGGGFGSGTGLSLSSVEWPVAAPPGPATGGAFDRISNGARGPQDFIDAQYAASAASRSGAEAAYDRGAVGAGVVAAVIDSGVTDPDGNLFGGRLIHAEADTDPGAHGTKVASVLAASRGATGYNMHGVAWGAQLRGYAAPAGPQPDGKYRLSQAGMATDVNSASAAGAEVINISASDGRITGQPLGVAGGLGEALYRATRNGAIIVVASGNEGGAHPSTLAAFPLYAEAALKDRMGAGWTGNAMLGRYLAVAALNGGDTGLASFSNACGAARYFCLSASGVNVRAVGADGNEHLVAGTSFAAPQVAGAVALLKDLWPALRPEEITEILLRTADDLGAPGVDEVFGYGRLNLDRATAPLGETALPSPGAYPRLATNGSVLSEAALVVNPTMAPVMASLAAGGPSLAFFDSYGRGFRIRLAAFARAARNRLDLADAFAGFAQRRDVVIPVGENGALRLAADPEAGPNAATRAVRFSGAGMSVTVARGGRPSDIAGVASFASASAPEGYIDAARLEHPFLALAEDARSAGVSMELGAGISAGLFLSSGETEAGVDVTATGVTAQKRFDAGAELSVTLGAMREEGGMLGATGTGALAMGQADTAFASLAGRAPLSDDLALVADAHLGATRLGDGGALVSGGYAVSTGWNIGIERRNAFLKDDALRLSVGQPLTVENGEMAFTLPEFSGGVSRARAALDGGTREMAVRLGWTGRPSARDSVHVGATMRLNADGARGETDGMAGVRWRRDF